MYMAGVSMHALVARHGRGGVCGRGSPSPGWMDACLYIGMASLLPKLCSGMDKWAWGHGVGVMLVSWVTS